MSLCVAVLGATGAVGRTMLQLLAERSFPVGELRLFASDRSVGTRLACAGREVEVRAPDAAGFRGVNLALFASNNPQSEAWAPVALEAGAFVVDNSSAFRYRDEIPLVVPEVNGHLLGSRPRLVANPNCSTIQLVVALQPLQQAAGLERVVVATYQAVSGAGAEPLATLERQAREGVAAPPPALAEGAHTFAFNVVPMIDRLEPSGYSREEMKIVWESRKILGLPELRITATAVRVPVRVGHSEAVNVTLRRALSAEEAREVWRRAPGVKLVDDAAEGRFPTPLQAAGGDLVWVGRVRRDLSQESGLDFWVTADNLRKGAATNAVQIAEQLVGAGVASA